MATALNGSRPPAAAPSRLRRAAGTLREAVVGSQQDFTEGSLGRAILLLAVPMVLEMLMESLFAVVNVFYVARWLSKEAVAAVGLTESLLTIVFAVAIGLSMGTIATVSRRVGERDPEGAAVAAVQAVILGVVISVPVGLLGVFYMPTLFRLMGAEPGVVALGAGYGRIIVGGNVVIMLLFLINGIFRGAGDAALAMRALWLANLVNIVLDPCLIFGLGPFPELGVTGSAVATTIGRGTGVAFQLAMLLGGRSRVHVRCAHLRLDAGVASKLLRLSLGGIFQLLIATASWVGLMRIVAVFGSQALAGYTIAIRIVVFALLPSWGLSNAAATLVGQNLGAGKPARAERSVWLTGFGNMIFLGCVGLVFIAFAEPVVGLFTQEAAVAAYAVSCLRLLSYGYVFYAYGMVVVQAFNGAGDTYTPTLINLFCFWLLQIPMAYALALRAGFGARGVFLAITIAESLLAVVGVLLFRRGRWKEQKV